MASVKVTVGPLPAILLLIMLQTLLGPRAVAKVEGDVTMAFWHQLLEQPPRPLPLRLLFLVALLHGLSLMLLFVQPTDNPRSMLNLNFIPLLPMLSSWPSSPSLLGRKFPTTLALLRPLLSYLQFLEP